MLHVTLSIKVKKYKRFVTVFVIKQTLSQECTQSSVISVTGATKYQCVFHLCLSHVHIHICDFFFFLHVATYVSFLYVQWKEKVLIPKEPLGIFIFCFNLCVCENYYKNLYRN